MSLDALKRFYGNRPKTGEAKAKSSTVLHPLPEPEAERFPNPTLVIKNSFCSLHSIPTAAVDAVEAALTYTNESIAQEKARTFRLMAMAKGQGKMGLYHKLVGTLKELDEQEVVCWLKQRRSFPTGHLAIVRGVLAEQGVPLTEDDRRKLPVSQHVFHFKNPQHPLRYYQEDMTGLGIENARGVFVSAVGTGKSRILAELLHRLAVTSLVVVPSTALLEQVYRGLENAFGGRYVGKVETAKIKAALTSKRKKPLKLPPIRIATIQTLAAMQKAGLLGAVISDLDLIAVDEIHHAGSKSYTQLLPELEHVYYRFGFIGTFTRNDCKTLDMWGFLSNVLYQYPAWKATEEGYLTPVEFLIHTLRGRSDRNYQKEYAKNYCGGEALLEEIQDIFQKYVTPKEQVLILVDRKDAAGLVIHEMLNDLGIENTYVSGDDAKDDVSEAILGFNSKEINVLVGSTIVGEGVDVYATDRLILARGGKSEIAIPQAIGRAIRLSAGKSKAFVHDFRFEGTEYMKKHLDMRLELYRDSFGGKIREV